MEKTLNNTNINYYYRNNNKNVTLLLLHGWGQNIEMMKPISDNYENFFNILILDLPGFGKSDEPDTVWSVYDYVDLIHELIKSLNLKKVIIIGHSFGGRLGLIYASMYEIEKLICLASPYCKELTKLPLKTRIYKTLKQIPLLKPIANIMKKYIGSTDYKNASEIMRGVLVNSINIDMVSDVKKIKCPTLLVWGTLDTAVPIKRAYELKELIKDSGVVEFNGASHYAYLERLNELIKVLDSFFNIRR
ncbi:MAG: alpha/beta hydrolase [Bacilli bacterium]|nr:alpha/beta hydrolase [Bacilli bacterium]